MYLSFAKSNGPKIVFNAINADKSYQWLHVPVEMCLPTAQPADLLRKGLATSWEVIGPAEDPAQAAVWCATFLTMAILKELHLALSFSLPEKGKGSGKNGNIVKRDYADAIVNHFYPNSEDKEKTRMVQGIMGNTVKVTECPREVLAALRKADPDTASDFSYLEKHINNQIELEKQRHVRAQSESFYEQLESTPEPLTLLAPTDENRQRWGYINRKMTSSDSSVP